MQKKNFINFFKFNDKLSKLYKEDRFYEIKLHTVKNERLQQTEAAEEHHKKSKKRTKLVDFVDRRVIDCRLLIKKLKA